MRPPFFPCLQFKDILMKILEPYSSSIKLTMLSYSYLLMSISLLYEFFPGHGPNCLCIISS